jgi:hypothetical protein
MEPTNMIYRQAEIAYRRSYLTDQFSRSAAAGDRSHDGHHSPHRWHPRLHRRSRTTPAGQ